MKKTQITTSRSHNLLLWLFIMLTVSSCRISNDDWAIGQQQKVPFIWPEVNQGLLQFESHSHFLAYASKAKEIGSVQRRIWEHENGFESRLTIYENILQAEQSNFDAYIDTNVPKDLAEEELATFTLPFPNHTKIYSEAVSAGQLLVHEDTDTSSTYTINSPLGYASALDKDGFVMIGDTLSLYLKGVIKHWRGGNPDGKEVLRRATKTDLDNGILVGLKENQTRSSYSWSTYSYYYKWEYNDNGKRRGAYEIDGWATDFGVANPTMVEVENQFEIYVERKLFGNWVAHLTYTPFIALWGNWTTIYGLTDLAHPCAENYTITTNWPGNNFATSAEFPVLSETIVTQTSPELILMYPIGQFNAPENQIFCEVYRSTYLDANVVVHGDGGGIIPLGTHVYNE